MTRILNIRSLIYVLFLNLFLSVRAEAAQEDISQKKLSYDLDISKKFISDKGGTPALLYWKDDFILSTPDETFWMKIRGNLHMDTKFYRENNHNPSTIDIRRARIDLQGGFYQYITFRLQAEFADSPHLRNGWVDYGYRDWLHLRAGQMKPPFSTSWWTLDNNVNFIERGAGTPVYPFFDRGFWLWGELLSKTVTYNLSAWTGAGMETDYAKGDIDDHKDFIWRLFLQPFKFKKGVLGEKLYLCAQGSYGQQSIPSSRFETKGYSAAIRDDKFWIWTANDNNAYVDINSRTRWGGEVHYIYGPASLSSEYLITAYDDIFVLTAKNGNFVMARDGEVASWSSWISYFITGEQKQVSNWGWRQPSPIHDFEPLNFKGPGAWELLLRYTYTRTDSNLFDTIPTGGREYNILKGSPEIHEYTIGINWTWNAMVRWQLNYVHIDSSDGILSGDKDSAKGQVWLKDEEMFALRMIFKL